MNAYPSACVSQRGMTSVELAIVLPVLLMVVFAIIEFGYAMWNYNTISYAVREGARYAAVSSTDSNVVENTINSVISNGSGLSLTPADIVISWLPDQNPGSLVSVTATKPYTSFTGYVSGFSMKSSAVLVVSR
ncbi:MAG: pilus assembly protein [Sheuella sp.]|nr:pilus assembly protein [Sheuella sp.]